MPADAKAVLISPSIVGDRFIQLTPVYKGGGVLADNAHLGTTAPRPRSSSTRSSAASTTSSIALGPQGANKTDGKGVGALTRLLDSTARNFGGQGVKFNKTLQNLGKFTKTLADNKDELFGTLPAGREVHEDPGGQRRPPSASSTTRSPRRRPARRRARRTSRPSCEPGHRRWSQVRGFVKENKAC